MFLQAQVIHVPADQPTVQAGIDAASDGDTVLVAEGTYLENISFLGKAITVASHYILDADTNHINNTILDGSQPEDPDWGATVLFNSGEDTTSVLCGFTITGGTGVPDEIFDGRAGGGIALMGSVARIRNNKVTGNSVYHPYIAIGGGIACIGIQDDKMILIEDNIISNNHCLATNQEAVSGGIFSAVSARMTGNLIEYNSCECEYSYANGGGVEVSDLSGMPADFYFMDNIVRYNEVSSPDISLGAGVSSWFSNTYIFNNSIYLNTVTGQEADGAGIHLYHPEKTEISGNNIYQNAVVTENEYWGAGISCLYPEASLVLEHNTMDSNHGPIYVGDPPELIETGVGGGICVLDALMNEVIADGNILIGNTAKHGGGFYSRNSFNLFLFNNIMEDNITYNGGGTGIYHSASASVAENEAMLADTLRPVIANNTFIGNTAEYQGGGLRVNCFRNFPVTFNNIFWLNTASNGPDIGNFSTSELEIYHSDLDTNLIGGTWNGYGNIYADPGFIDFFHIDQESPCYQAGVDSILSGGAWYYAPGWDIEGDQRPFPDPICPGVEMGADEVSDYCVGVAEQARPGRLMLEVAPNPARGHTMINVTMPGNAIVSLDLYDITGSKVRTMASGQLGQGQFRYTLNAETLKDGIYLLRLTAGKEVVAKKVLVKK